MARKAKASLHSGGNASGSAKHNDKNRDFKKVSNSQNLDYIDDSKSSENINLIFRNGSFEETSDNLGELARARYEEVYGKALAEQNEKYISTRHKERVKTIDDWMKDSRHGARETILQIGSDEYRASKNGEPLSDNELKNELESCFKELDLYMQDLLQEHYIPMHAAIHMDELTPHLHWDYSIAEKDKDTGTMKPGLDKGLEQAGIELPNPDRLEEIQRFEQEQENRKAREEGRKPKKIKASPNKYNNRLVTLTAMMRDKWEDIILSHGIEIDRSEHCDRQHEDQNRHRQKKLAEDITIKEKTSEELDREISAKQKGGIYKDSAGDYKVIHKGDSAEGILSKAKTDAAIEIEKMKNEAAEQVREQAYNDVVSELRADISLRKGVEAEIREEIAPSVQKAVKDEIRALEDGSSALYRQVVSAGYENPDIERHVDRDPDGSLALDPEGNPVFLEIDYRVGTTETIPLAVEDYPNKVKFPFIRKVFDEFKRSVLSFRDKILGAARTEVLKMQEEALKDHELNAFINKKLNLIPESELLEKKKEMRAYIKSHPELSELGFDEDMSVDDMKKIDERARDVHIADYVRSHSSYRSDDDYWREEGRKSYNTSGRSMAIFQLMEMAEEYQEMKVHPHNLEELQNELTAFHTRNRR